ncbi:hypothetical protein WN943_020422 [Citrus x changshan-huyou]
MMGKYGPTVLLGVPRRMLEMQSPSDLESHIERPIAPYDFGGASSRYRLWAHGALVHVLPLVGHVVVREDRRKKHGNWDRRIFVQGQSYVTEPHWLSRADWPAPSHVPLCKRKMVASGGPWGGTKVHFKRIFSLEF